MDLDLKDNELYTPPPIPLEGVDGVENPIPITKQIVHVMLGRYDLV